MSTYRLKDGNEIIVCDGCGLGEDGAKPDLEGAAKFDLTAEMLAAGFPAGTSCDVQDWCPDCSAKRKEPA